MNLEERRNKLAKTDKRNSGIVTSPAFAMVSLMLIGEITNVEIKMGSATFFISLAILLAIGYLVGYYLPRKLRKQIC
ncbi:MAG: hypothetical protein WCN88_00775 [Candidatus Falkowbacteria bacterium]